MVALSDESTLASMIVGRVVETCDIQRQATYFRDDVIQQAKRNASFASISDNVSESLKQKNVQLNKFDVEDIYEADPDGDYNADVWFAAEKLDAEARQRIKTVNFLKIIRLNTGLMWDMSRYRVLV